MNAVNEGTRRQTLGAAAILVILGALVAFILFSRRGGDAEQGFAIVGQGAVPAPAPAPPTSAPPGGGDTPPPAATPPAAEVVVHVAGAVARPGVYHLAPGDRVADAVRLAGGPTAKANTDAVNLAARAEDGTQIYLPTRAEAPPGTSAASPGAGSHARSQPRAAAPPGGPPQPGGAKLRQPGEGTVNVNTADDTELQRLPGVGPAMSARIVQYRKENGAFASADDLMNVSGIGPKKLEKMKPFVRVR